MNHIKKLVFVVGTLFGVAACSPVEPRNNFGVDQVNSQQEEYVQVDRMGMPAIATAVISSKDDYNFASPADDANGDFVNEIVNNVTVFHNALDDDLQGLGLTPCAISDCVGAAAPFVVPDVITIDTTQAAGFPNGRRLEDQVMDVTLALVLLDLNQHPVDLFAGLPLNPASNDKEFSTQFPYLAAPHEL